MKILKNKNKYLDLEVIEGCFETGKMIFCDKVVTGNGFTTGFGMLTPSFGKVNVLIAPNQSIVKDKQREHAQGKFAPNKNVAFVYEGSGLRGKVQSYQLIVLVADSFVNYAFQLKGNVDKLMVDEYHSVIIQSAFRYKLKKMMYTLQDDFKDIAISFVTASPLLYSKIDVRIVNTYMDKRVLHTSNNIEESIKRCVESIESGRKVMIFAQDSSIIKRILRDAQRNDFKLIAGISFTTTLLSKEVFRLNEDSNIVICSSAGFEGHSDYSDNGDTYIYMNLGNAHNTFLGCNIYQAIGRLRNGFKYAEACVTNLAGGGFPNKIITDLDAKINKLIEIDDIPIEKKQSKGFEFYYRRNKVTGMELIPYIYYKRDKNIYTIHKYDSAIDVHNETKQIDTRLSLYSEYFKVRCIDLIDIDIDISQKRLMSRTRREQRVINVVENVTGNNLQENFMDFFFKAFNPENKREYYINEIDIMQEAAFNCGIEIDNKYEVLKQYLINGYEKEIKEIFVASKKKNGYGRDKIRHELLSFDDITYPLTVDIAVGIIFDRFDSNIVGHRDYNKLTMIGISLIEFVASKLGLCMVEVDIKNCFPRIVYALNGLELPIDFYGIDRSKNKKRINSALNMFRYDVIKNRTQSKQATDSRLLLSKATIDERCVNWLMSNHFLNAFRGDFFNFLAYHERCIIGAAIEKMRITEPNAMMYRRHDSFIAFTDISYSCLNDFEYLGYEGWFDSYTPSEDDFDLDEYK